MHTQCNAPPSVSMSDAMSAFAYFPIHLLWRRIAFPRCRHRRSECNCRIHFAKTKARDAFTRNNFSRRRCQHSFLQLCSPLITRTAAPRLFHGSILCSSVCVSALSTGDDSTASRHTIWIQCLLLLLLLLHVAPPSCPSHAPALGHSLPCQ